MKTKLALILLAPAVALAAPARQGTGAGACPLAADNPACSPCPLDSVSVATPTSLSAAALIAAVEEERLAHDVYVAAAAKWNLPVFTRIAQSESQHEAALMRLAASADIAVPPAQPGVYATADLQQMHAMLMPLVNESVTGALQAGALIEETDIVDLRDLRAKATDEPTRTVLANLERASGHHLQAFVGNLTAQGVSYAPKVLAADDYSAILKAADTGRGMHKGNNVGKRPGMGGGMGAGYRGGR